MSSATIIFGSATCFQTFSKKSAIVGLIAVNILRITPEIFILLA